MCMRVNGRKNATDSLPGECEKRVHHCPGRVVGAPQLPEGRVARAASNERLLYCTLAQMFKIVQRTCARWEMYTIGHMVAVRPTTNRPTGDGGGGG